MLDKFVVDGVIVSPPCLIRFDVVVDPAPVPAEPGPELEPAPAWERSGLEDDPERARCIALLALPPPALDP